MKLACIAMTALVACPALAGETLIARGSSWKYLDTGTNLFTTWRAPNFDDSAWASGSGELGYGDGDEATVVSYGPNHFAKYVTTYFRRSFDVADPALFSSLFLRVRRDDGVVVYLNGSELVRDNLTGTVGFNKLANVTIDATAEITWLEYELPTTLLLAGTNVLAAEIHQKSQLSDDISFELELVGCDPACLIRGPYLQSGSHERVVVRWRTLQPTESRVVYGLAANALTSTVSNATLATEHEVELTGLAPATRYHYAVGTATELLAGGDAAHSFVTAPTPGTAQPTRIWVLGDSGTANQNARAVRDAYAAFNGARHTDLWLMLGDNAYFFGTDSEHQTALFDTYDAMLRASVLWPTRGNHDDDLSVYEGVFSLPTAGQAGGLPSGTEAYYAFDWANVHFVCLDSYGSDRSVGGAMWTWAQADLAANVSDWVIAFWHHPPYSKGSHDSDFEAELIEMRESFLPLLEAHGVDLVLSGHSHGYERSFLLDGHYGTSDTLAASMLVDSGDGRIDGDGPYVVGSAQSGSLYCVAGSSGRADPGAFDHPAMFVSFAELGSLVLDVDGGRLDAQMVRANGQVADRFTLLASDYAAVYCTSQTTASGCVPAIGFSGDASATATQSFDISLAGVDPGRCGILFFGFASSATPYLDGTFCVRPPVRRTPVQVSSGGGSCSASFRFDFNARIQAGLDAELAPGASVFAQYWFRDPGSPSCTAFSDALSFVVQG